MRKLTTLTFVTLDGVMQSPGGPDEDPTGGFTLGGWTTPYWDDQTERWIDEALNAPFDLLLGRKTYEIFAAHWPYDHDATLTSAHKPPFDAAEFIVGQLAAQTATAC